MIEKRDIYHEVRAQLRNWYPEEREHGSCFYWAHAGWRVLTEYGFDVLFQAGSMSWPMVPKDRWFSEAITHFSYLWSPESERSQQAMAIGKMPEIHIWLALPQRLEIVDFSTGTLPLAAETQQQFKWTGPRPPDFLWTTFDRLPEGVFYKADKEATLYLLRKIEADCKLEPAVN